MAAFLLLPLSIAAGVVAGRIAARNAVREEMAELRELLRARNGDARQIAPEPPPSSSPLPPAAAPIGEEPRQDPVTAPAPATEEEISPEILMVLTAAVAAFMGKKVRIRRASIAAGPGSSAWAQQGRVFVQASHNLPVQHR